MGDRIRATGEHPVAYGVATGRFSGDRADFWVEHYLADPVGTTAMIESMSPVLAMGSSLPDPGPITRAGGGGGENPDAFAHLFPPAPGRIDAAHEARVAQVAAMTDEELEAELFGPQG